MFIIRKSVIIVTFKTDPKLMVLYFLLASIWWHCVIYLESVSFVISLLSNSREFHFNICVCRDTQVLQWKKVISDLSILFNEEYDFIYNIGSDIKIQNWILSGLPSDKFSLHNAVILDNTDRWVASFLRFKNFFIISRFYGT